MTEVICIDGCGLSEIDCSCCCDDECPVSIVRNRNEARLKRQWYIARQARKESK